MTVSKKIRFIEIHASPCTHKNISEDDLSCTVWHEAGPKGVNEK